MSVSSVATVTSPSRLGPGAFVAVVGPSGAGKDTLIAFARERLADREDIVVARRVVTRTADPDSEDHDSLDERAFERQSAAGAFALTWRAHGLSYGLPAALEATIAAGGVVIANVSRRVLPELHARYANVIVALVSAHPDIIRQRLERRGREDAEAIERRVGRIAMELPAAGDCIVFENSGPPEHAGGRLVALLLDVARPASPEAVAPRAGAWIET